MLCYLSNGLDWPRSVPLICRTSSHSSPHSLLDGADT